MTLEDEIFGTSNIWSNKRICISVALQRARKARSFQFAISTDPCKQRPMYKKIVLTNAYYGITHKVTVLFGMRLDRKSTRLNSSHL